MAAATRVDLHLRCRVKPGMREAFLAFLREATPFYESPGGITIRLLEDMSEDHRFVELVLYDDEATYLKDQERVAHDEYCLLEGKRFFDEIERTHLDRAHRRFDVAVARNHNDLRVHLTFPHPRQRGQPVHTGQPDVEDDHVKSLPGQTFKTRLSALDGLDTIAFVTKHTAKCAPHPGLVVHDQNRRHCSDGKGHAVAAPTVLPSQGSSITKRVPRGALLVTSMLPPCSTTIRLTMASPRPLPRLLVE